jgi:hypothetical protein
VEDLDDGPDRGCPDVGGLTEARRFFLCESNQGQTLDIVVLRCLVSVDSNRCATLQYMYNVA